MNEDRKVAKTYFISEIASGAVAHAASKAQISESEALEAIIKELVRQTFNQTPEASVAEELISRVEQKLIALDKRIDEIADKHC